MYFLFRMEMHPILHLSLSSQNRTHSLFFTEEWDASLLQDMSGEGRSLSLSFWRRGLFELLSWESIVFVSLFMSRRDGVFLIIIFTSSTIQIHKSFNVVLSWAIWFFNCSQRVTSSQSFSLIRTQEKLNEWILLKEGRERVSLLKEGPPFKKAQSRLSRFLQTQRSEVVSRNWWASLCRCFPNRTRRDSHSYGR